MIFKPRRPTSDNLAAAENDSEEIRPDEPAAGAAEKEAGSDAMVGAFEALARVVSREMKSVKKSIAELEIGFTRRLDSEKQEIHTIVNELKREMTARVETLRQSQEKAISDLSGQSKSSIDGLRTRLEPTLEQAVKRTEQIKSGLEQMLAEKGQKLEQELLVLTRNLSGVRTDLEKQISTSGRVSSLLNGMADVFSNPESLPDESPKRGRPEGTE